MRQLTLECNSLLLQIVKRLGVMLYPQITDDEWEESKHKRDKNGRFTSTGGGEGTKATATEHSPKPKAPKMVTGADMAKSEKAQKVRNTFEKFGGSQYEIIPPGVNQVTQTIRKYGPDEEKEPGKVYSIPENTSKEDYTYGVFPRPDGEYSDESKGKILSGGRVVLSSLYGRDIRQDRLRIRSMVENEVSILGGIRQDGVYYRVTDNPKEKEYLKNGTIRASVNHRTGEKEDGLSCWEIPKYFGKYMYRISGKVVSVGSDGEPVLDPKTVKLLPMYSSKKMQEMEKRGKEEFCRLYDWTEAQLDKALKY